jgi:hypothetical protein
MTFTPQTEAEIREGMVWPEGEYGFEVTACDNTTSKSGNKMLAISLRIYSGEKQTTVKDWLVESDSPLPLMKLRHYCRAVGAMEAYETGTVDSFPGVGSAGKLKLGIEDSVEYGPQNRVSDYLPAPEGVQPTGVPAAQTKRAMAAQDSSIPF